MKEYVKPVVLANEELAEGVYAASGDTCWTVTQRGDVIDSYEGRKVFYINLSHNGADHETQGVNVTFVFNFNVKQAFSGGGSTECNGNTVTTTYTKDTVENLAETNLFINVAPEDDISAITPAILSMTAECIR